MLCWRTLLLALALVHAALASGIPMWEFLDRSEKVNKLFHVYMRQVDDFCNSSDMPDCNKAMMVHGLSSLARMQDQHLDTMDPYQRDAHELIWNAMMHDHDAHHAEPTPADTSNNGIGNNKSNEAGEETAASSQSEVVSAPATGGGPMMTRLRPDGSPVPGDPPGGHHRTPDMDMFEHRLMSQMPHNLRPRDTKFPFLAKKQQ